MQNVGICHCGMKEVALGKPVETAKLFEYQFQYELWLARYSYLIT